MIFKGNANCWFGEVRIDYIGYFISYGVLVRLVVVTDSWNKPGLLGHILRLRFHSTDSLILSVRLRSYDDHSEGIGGDRDHESARQDHTSYGIPIETGAHLAC